jgi:hypothetical protein
MHGQSLVYMPSRSPGSQKTCDRPRSVDDQSHIDIICHSPHVCTPHKAPTPTGRLHYRQHEQQHCSNCNAPWMPAQSAGHFIPVSRCWPPRHATAVSQQRRLTSWPAPENCTRRVNRPVISLPTTTGPLFQGCPTDNAFGQLQAPRKELRLFMPPSAGPDATPGRASGRCRVAALQVDAR